MHSIAITLAEAIRHQLQHCAVIADMTAQNSERFVCRLGFWQRPLQDAFKTVILHGLFCDTLLRLPAAQDDVVQHILVMLSLRLYTSLLCCCLMYPQFMPKLSLFGLLPRCSHLGRSF